MTWGSGVIISEIGSGASEKTEGRWRRGVSGTEIARKLLSHRVPRDCKEGVRVRVLHGAEGYERERAGSLEATVTAERRW